MKFTTIRLKHSRSEIQIESIKHYDIYSKISTIAEFHNDFKIYKWNKFYDLIGLVDPWNLAISEKFKSILEVNNIKGWKCYPIKIENVNTNYFLLEIIGYVGIVREYDKDGDRIYGTTEVETKTWDGSDIFHIGETGIRVCTPKLKEIIEKAKISNIEFCDLNRY